MSAIADGDHEPIQVLFTLHPGFDTMDVVGPMEVLNTALHDPRDKSSKAFEVSLVSSQPGTSSAQGLTVKADMNYDDAHQNIEDYDILVVPGGSTDAVLKTNAEPISLIQAFAEMQKKDPSKERTLMSVCTGSLFLAQAGILQGLCATTHPDHYAKLEIVCAEAARRDLGDRTDVMEERYVVNNARFDLGDNLDDNPFIVSKPPLDPPPTPGSPMSNRNARRASIARKGSDAWRESNRRRESNARRAALRLGGLRVITSGGITAGLDAACYLVGAMVSHDSAVEVARIMQYQWNKGVTVEAVDV
ncbi:MAG: hypothetical protein M1821_004334 [Bathelium mastoideum]|nr:MAG: hypothetical protein M1821_004334 [Bathelium mastoideum]KAI9684000.1 MAG: hypothetical protein M1822_005827 [Bathelium mastoideum]